MRDGLTGFDILSIRRLGHNEAVSDREGLRRALQWGGALALHAAILFLLIAKPPLESQSPSGAFGDSVRVTLVAAGPSAGNPPSKASPSLEAMANRLAEVSEAAAQATSNPSARTSLSNLLGEPLQMDGVAGSASPTPTPSAFTSTDDPFARTGVSYRGLDPRKAASLQRRVRSCSKTTGAMQRLLVIIDADGRLVGKPRLLGAIKDQGSAERTIAAIERCGPYAMAASPGAPRSYEIQLD